MNCPHKNFFLLFVTFIFFQNLLSAQTYSFRHYTIEDGLAQTQVTSLLQDKKGYLWIGTSLGGVSKFDGITFTNYTMRNGLPDNQVLAIAEDKNTNLWFGTSKGISKFDGKNFINFSTADGLPADLIMCLFTDSKNNLWAGTRKGLCRYSIAEKIWTTYNTENGLSKNFVTSVIEDKNGSIWISTIGGGINQLIFQNEKTAIHHFSVQDGLPDSVVKEIFLDSKGKLWATTRRGLSVFSENKFTNYGQKDSLTHNNLGALCEDHEGRIWISCQDHEDIFIYDRKNFKILAHRDGLTDHGTRTILKDRENNIWLGTDNGLLKFGGEKFVNVTANAGEINSIIFPIFEKSENEFWFGTALNGVLIYDGKKIFNYRREDGTAGNIITNIIRDNASNIWMGTNNDGITKYDGKKFTNYTTKDGLIYGGVSSLLQDKNGVIWVGTARGLCKLVNGKYICYTKENGLPNEQITEMVQGKDGIFWLATNGGLCRFDGDTSFQFITQKDGLNNEHIVSLLLDKDENIWLGTIGGGINFYDQQKKKIEIFNSEHGLYDDVVIAMTFDKNGNLWAGTNKGVDKLDVTEYKKSEKKIFTHYGKSEGFLGIECNSSGAYTDSKGNLWFGTIKGAVKYNPLKDIPNTIEPQTHLTNVRMFFDDFDWKNYCDSIDSNTSLPLNPILPYKKNHLTFDFVGISFTNPEKVRYIYFLEGMDEDWSPPTRNNHITYSNIQPGEYTFLVKACNNDGVWNKTPLKFHFQINPPFWKTWWFYLLVAGLIIAIIRWRIAKLQRDKMILERKVAERTAEVVKQKDEISQQKSLIEKKNKDITASIQYAKRIQETTLPMKEKLGKIIPDSFILFKPRDIVSGDFYWFTEKNGKIILAVVDCTGHGVPGAFMSLIGNNLLNEIILKNNITEPSSILHQLDMGLIFTLKKDELDSFAVDGMDIALCVIDKNNFNLDFAAAGRSLMVVRNHKIMEVKGNRIPIGLMHRKKTEENGYYKGSKFNLEKGDCIYIFSDGFCDQFGGKEGDKFLISSFEKLVLDIHNQPMQEQEKILFRTIEDWRGSHPQIDDMLIIGVKI